MKGITHITVFHTKLQCCTFYYKYHNRYDNVNNTIKCDIIERVTKKAKTIPFIFRFRMIPCIIFSIRVSGQCSLTLLMLTSV